MYIQSQIASQISQRREFLITLAFTVKEVPHNFKKDTTPRKGLCPTVSHINFVVYCEIWSNYINENINLMAIFCKRSYK